VDEEVTARRDGEPDRLLLLRLGAATTRPDQQPVAPCGRPDRDADDEGDGGDDPQGDLAPAKVDALAPPAHGGAGWPRGVRAVAWRCHSRIVAKAGVAIR
jgi:hypothetical protein